MDLSERCEVARRIANEAGDLALDYFRRPENLHVDRKGHQDFVSQADRDVERLVRTRLSEAFPGDGIVGEEEAPKQGQSGFTWVIDPIDGTTNFVHSIPGWTVAIAGVSTGRTRIGVIHDACHDETFVATQGEGATLNGRRLSVPIGLTLKDGTTGIGYSNRVGTEGVMRLMQGILDEGGIFLRNASGALSIAYVAAGRLLGYAEEHMNAWDCLAGQLIVSEAGGGVEDQDADRMIETGGRVVVGVPGVFEQLVRMSDAAFG